MGADNMVEVPRIRLLVLRGIYAFIVVGLGLFVWPSYLAAVPDLPLFNSVALTMLAAFSILCLLGIRYPLKMLPVLLWEVLWKGMWLVIIALPLWMNGQLDDQRAQTVIDCLVGVILVPLAIPWSYVWDKYVRTPAERARAPASRDSGSRGDRAPA